jgi:hypothetical protein
MRWEAIVGYNMLPGALRGFKNAIFFSSPSKKVL